MIAALSRDDEGVFMIKDIDDHITLTDEEGNESLYHVLFTFESEDYGKAYILVYPDGEEEELSVEAYEYKESETSGEGTLYPVETEEEWDMIEEVFNTFQADDEEE